MIKYLLFCLHEIECIFYSMCSYPFLRLSAKIRSEKRLKSGKHIVGQSRTTPEPLAHNTNTTSTTTDHVRSSRTIPEPLLTKQSHARNCKRNDTNNDHFDQSRTTTPEPLPTRLSPNTNQMNTTIDQTKPPHPTIHQTLLQKLRLGSPTHQHVQFSIINSRKTKRERASELDAIQLASPFPKLPAYFTGGVSSTVPSAEVVGGCSDGSDRGGGGMTTTDGEPGTLSEQPRFSSGWSQDHMTKLPTNPWNIPEYRK